MRAFARPLPLLAILAISTVACSGGGHNDNNFHPDTPPPPLTDSREFRAIAGVSMGAYGAMNIATKHPELFGTIAALGGPLDMTELLHHIVTDNLEVVYFLSGYGYDPSDFNRVGDLLDVLILSGQLQNMFFVFLPGAGGIEGSFYVNHIVPESQAPQITTPTSGRYEDSIVDDLIPAIEDQILERRVRL